MHVYVPVSLAAASSFPSTECGHAVLTPDKSFVMKLLGPVGDFVRAVDDGHHFGIAHVEEGGAIGRRDHTNDGMQLPHLQRAATIEAETLGINVLRRHS